MSTCIVRVSVETVICVRHNGHLEFGPRNDIKPGLHLQECKLYLGDTYFGIG